ncbi:MAG TPA: GAF domain-containing protein [Thermoanaerobaculia bacterium]|nr:GAF domain-containing protein [Thermoanaerobaculia bacterium]
MAAGLESNELCLWLFIEPFGKSESIKAFRRDLPDFDQHLASGALMIGPAEEWLTEDGSFNVPFFNRKWDTLLVEMKERGFDCLRVGGACFPGLRWDDIRAHEQSLNESLGGRPVIMLCCFPLETTEAVAIIDVAQTHHLAIAQRDGRWDVVETPVRRLQQLETRSRQQNAVVRLGLRAIRERDVDALMKEAVTIAAQTLGTGRGIVWQVRPEHDDFIRRSQAGWDELPADLTIPMDDGSLARFIVAGDKPVIVADLEDDTPFEKPQIMRDLGIASMIAGIIRGREQVWGFLSVHSLTARSFDGNDLQFMESIANVLALTLERHEHELAELREKEMFQTIFDNIPVMISIALPSGVRYRNPECERVLGTADEATQFDGQLDDGGAHGWIDTQVRARNGNLVDTSWARFRLSDGTSIQCGIDITERKQAEAERARLQAATEAALVKLRAIQSITDAALGRMALDDLLRELLGRLQDALHVDAVGVALLDERNLLVCRAGVGSAALVPGTRIPMSLPLWRRLTTDPRAVVLEDYLEGAPPEARDWVATHMGPVRSAMTAPLIVEEKLIGAVVADSNRYRRFEADELELLRVVADRVAPVIERGRLLESVRAGRERLEALSHRLLSVQEEERRRVAIELHDELGQILTAVKINLESLPFQVQNAVDNVDRAMQTTRDLALDLRPPMLDDLGLAAALRWYADRFAQQTHLAVHLAIEEIPDLPPALATACFRVAQEALTNIARHAAARNVRLDVHRTSRAVELTVRDDGAGFNVEAAFERVAQGASMGLAGMEERVSLVGGTIDVQSTPGRGTEVRVRFPLKVAHEADSRAARG